MITSPQNILYLSLAVGFIILVIFLCVTLLYVIMILHDVNHIVEKSRKTVDTVNDYVVKPVKIINRLTDSLMPIIGIIEKKVEEKIKKHRKK